MITLETIADMEAAGCSEAQILAVIRADLERRRVRRMVRRALKGLAPESAFTAPKADSADRISPAPGIRSNPIKSSARAGVLDAVGLTPSEKLVLSRLIEHNNLDSGRCDPGQAKIAEYTGLSGRSIRRAVQRLEARGLLRRIVNVGRGHTNAYELNLDAMAGLARPLGGKADSGEKRTLLAAKEDGRVRQNRVRKQSLQVPRARPDPSQPQFLLAFSGKPQAIAGSAARRRIHADLAIAADQGDSLNVSTATDADWAAAEVAEMKRPGQGHGLALLRERVATGPPSPAAATG